MTTSHSKRMQFRPSVVPRKCSKCATTKPSQDFLYGYGIRNNGYDILCRVCRMRKSRYAVRAAIARGEIERGRCELCGEHSVHAHHDNYFKPLDVRWLCAICHGIEHQPLPPLDVIDKNYQGG